MTKEEFMALAGRITNGTASEADVVQYHAYYQFFQRDQSWNYEKMGDKDVLEGELYARIHRQMEAGKSATIRRMPVRWFAAASILLVVGIGTYWYYAQNRAAVVVKQIAHQTIVPGSNKAILTLANGAKLVLDDQHQKNGLIAHQGRVVVHKIASGQLQYQVADSKATPGNTAATAMTYNTIATPRGGQYQIDLPDGTRVWLNSASSLVYPVAFNGTERVVKLTGEAYFEVAHINQQGGAMPFKVQVAGSEEVQVLGTHFNIMAYADEPAMITTLLQGSVRVVKNAESQIIKPGEQAVTGSHIVVSDADTEEAVAWKNGQTLFRNEDIQTIMRQVSRWYDVDVIYRGAVQARRFNGGLSRQSSLNGLLRILTLNHINCRVEGRAIILTP
jgi:ferric-dicitrate binding protein FerR (iron transport regulator)